MEINSERNVARSQEEWARFVEDRAQSYIEKRELDLVKNAQKYTAALKACRCLGVPSPEAAKAWSAGAAFWKEFEAYKARLATMR